uniref:5-hydroxytryptamine (serotonin) receptor 3A n=1 Tax=Tetraodon nigroviridis TaxID=99883 RepID=H3C4I0_TETNG
SEPTTLALLHGLMPIFELKDIRPVLNMTTVSVVSIDFVLYGILGVDEKAQVLTTYLWLKYWWKNEFVFWEPAECGIDKITVPRERFWYPDMVINEFMDEDKSPRTPYVYIYNTGHVFDDSPLRVVSTCKLGIYSFPFDIQNCSLTFGSYIHFDTDIQMFASTTAAEILEESLSVAQTKGEWELINIQVFPSVLEITDGKYSQLKYYLILRRRPILYVINLILPSIFLVTLDVFSFLLPPHSVDRSSFKMTLILGYTVFLLLMNDLLPVTGNETPLLSIYFSVCLALMVISLLETVVITNVLHHSSMKYQQVPNWVKVVVLRHIARLICYKWPQDVQEKDTSDNGNDGSGPWVIQSSSLTPAPQRDLPPYEPHPRRSPVPPACPGARSLPELQQICRYLDQLHGHVASLQKESELRDQWCHVGYILDFLLFRIYLLLISCYALVVVFMWCVWISQ